MMGFIGRSLTHAHVAHSGEIARLAAAGRKATPDPRPSLMLPDTVEGPSSDHRWSAYFEPKCILPWTCFRRMSGNIQIVLFPSIEKIGSGARIRTWECQHQKLVTYRLSTPDRKSGLLHARLDAM